MGKNIPAGQPGTPIGVRITQVDWSKFAIYVASPFKFSRKCGLVRRRQAVRVLIPAEHARDGVARFVDWCLEFYGDQ